VTCLDKERLTVFFLLQTPFSSGACSCTSYHWGYDCWKSSADTGMYFIFNLRCPPFGFCNQTTKCFVIHLFELILQCVINSGALPIISNMLTRNHENKIKKCACWVISNITAGTKEQIQVRNFCCYYPQ